PREAAEFARLCAKKQHFATSARLWTAAFAAKPASEREPRETRYFDAATSAVRAGCGFCHDEPRPDEKARVQLRTQALTWLRTELAVCAEKLRNGSSHDRAAIPQWLGRWEVDPSLAAVRDERALASLSGAEQAGWHAFWAEVRALKQQAKKYVPLPSLRGRP